MSITRIIELPPGSSPDEATNTVTRVAMGAVSIRPTHAALFGKHREALRETVMRYSQPGVVVAALVPGSGVAGHLWLQAGAELRAGIIGRHGRVDLYLGGDSGLSLRHMAVLARAVEGKVKVRVIDLRTPGGFDDEAGQRLEAVSADGPLFLGAARYQLFLLPTGGELPWREGDTDPWSTLPPRVYEERRPGTPPIARPILPQRRPGSSTLVSISAGPVALGGLPLLSPDEAPLGHLVVGTGKFEERIAVGRSALDRGVLLGRYDRCDSAGLSAFLDTRISRVHALIVRDAEQLYAVDTGSTNGLWLGNKEVRIHGLAPGEQLMLGEATALKWEPALPA